MSDKYWGWCPYSELDEKVYDLKPYGFKGTAVLNMEKFFVTIVFRQCDAPESIRMDMAYRVYIRFCSDSNSHVTPDIAKRLFPVKASEMGEAADMIIDGIEQINKYFFSVMKMNEYHDDIKYLMEVGIGVLDYFIGNLSHFRSELGETADKRIQQLKFKRSYMLSMQMHLYN